ncbi:MAG: ester cyclase [Candidatus Hodarchaeales archaeon]|jgi:predicted ester cyclase
MSNNGTMNTKAKEIVLEQYRLKIDEEEYYQIREEYKKHSIAEDKRDIPGLVSTLTEDSEYILVQTGHSWKGKEGAANFYTELLSAFPDIDFQLQNIVIGPQGVFQEAIATGTHKGEWLGTQPSGKKLKWVTLIFFPWDSSQKKFKGERMFSTLTEEINK